ncbi:unnamed protein product [Spodoptera exigua]|uniref:NAD(+) ADP-ribosyltransferase n=1 Tax=Spodoptera exigua TaxID=7107 RepID=A0A922MRT4_SPOEX|nr:hypothetical protein HF086_012648 [Spodoptera exigua]CAH0699798.1 unnamed protein product [Spodoptera exigua]
MPKDNNIVDLFMLRFKAEYAKSGRMKCRGCGQEIDQGTVRIAIIERVTCDYFSANDYKWHHELCFLKKIRVIITPDKIRDFSTLKDEDQKRIKDYLDEVAAILSKKRKSSGNKPAKKIKTETSTEAKNTFLQQNELLHKYRKALSGLSERDMEKLLEVNSQKIPHQSGSYERLDSLAECMAFGKLEPCEECKQGQLVLLTNTYKCTGNLTESTKCTYETQSPKRSPMIIPAEFEKNPIFKNFTPKTDVRLFGDVPKVDVKPETK